MYECREAETIGLNELISDPIGFLTSLLTLLPAMLPALILHEVAHGYAAYRLGDPTAKLAGRLSLNPLKHLDLLGTLSMFLIGLGWAKPVPINPMYFRHPRRDDFIVSIAGITANLIMFVIGSVLMYVTVSIGLSAVPQDMWLNADEYVVELGETFYRVSRADAFYMAPAIGDYLIKPYLGQAAGYVFEVFSNLAVLNICLACFNLLPIPPLDGYHVLNDLLLKKPLFAPYKIMQAGRLVLLVLMMTGLLDKGLSWAVNSLFDAMGRGVLAILGY